ncbi:hypothetical protein K8I61_12155 [bacterium]|nr:hypothetical protein [bacterium]
MLTARRVFVLALFAMISAKALLALLSLARPSNPIDFLRPVDDAYITHRYARNAGAGLGLVYNEGERVEGGTSVALIALLAPFAAFGVKRVDLVAVAISLLAQAGVVAIAWRHTTHARKRPPGEPEAFVATFLALSATSLVWAWAGMETAPMALCLLAALMGHLDEQHLGRWPLKSALATVAAGLFHPDGMLIAPVLGLSWLVPFNRDRAARGVFYGAIVVALFGGYWLWRWSYFGQLMPNTFYAKVGGSGAALLHAGLTYLRVAWFGTLVPIAFAALFADRAWRLSTRGRAWVAIAPAALAFLVAPNALMAVAALLIAVIAVTRPKPVRNLPRLVWLALGLAALHGLYIVRVGGDFYPFHRFFFAEFAPVTLAFWHLGRARTDDVEMETTDPKPLAAKAFARAAGLVLVLNVFAYFYTFQGLIHRDLQRVVRHFADVGRELGEHTPPDATIATLPIGAVGFFSERSIHDMMGLVEPNIAKMELDMTKGVVGHQKYDHAYSLSTRPEIVMVLPSAYERTPDGFAKWVHENALEPVQYRIYEEPRLRQDYRLVSLPVGETLVAFGFLRADLVGDTGYAAFTPLDDSAVAAAFSTPDKARTHPLHGKSFGIWSFK